MIKLRPEVQKFAEALERELREHDLIKGDGWKDFNQWDGYGDILGRLEEEVNELVLAHADPEGDPENPTTVEEIRNEALDVANFALFAWYHAEKAI